MKSLKRLREDAGVAVNNVGQGNIAGLGIGPQGEPGGPKSIMNRRKKVTKVLVRKKPVT